jgi:hypothetical protein
MYGKNANRDKKPSGGLVRGPGTGTSDSIKKDVAPGSFIMPADSTQALGLGEKMPVNLSNGEYELPPEQVHAVGVQALRQAKDATHTQVPEPQGLGRELFFVNGDVVEDERTRRQAEQLRQSAATGAQPQIASLNPVDRSNPAQEPYPGPAAMQQRSANLAEATVTNAGQGAINSAMTAQPKPVPGNPVRAAQMQAQADQPVTRVTNAGLAMGLPTPPDFMAGAGSYLASLGNGAANTPQGRNSPRQPVMRPDEQEAGELFSTTGAPARTRGQGPQPSRSLPLAPASLEPTGPQGRNTPRAGAASTALPTPSNDYTSERFGAWANKQQAPTAEAGPQAPAAQSSPTADPNAYQPTGIGAGANAIVGRMNNGVPEFTNNPTAQAGSDARGLYAGGKMGNGKGNLSFGEAGDSQMALDRFERANQERAKMVEISQRGEIGGGGGLTIVKDSSRGDTAELRRNERFMAQQDQSKRQGRLDNDASALAAGKAGRDSEQFAVEQQQRVQELETGALGLDSSRQLLSIKSQLSNPQLDSTQRAQLEATYNALTLSAKDRYMEVKGGENAEGNQMASTVLDRATGKTNTPGGGTQSARSSVPRSEIVATAKARGLTEEQVMAELKNKGVSVDG